MVSVAVEFHVSGLLNSTVLYVSIENGFAPLSMYDASVGHLTENGFVSLSMYDASGGHLTESGLVSSSMTDDPTNISTEIEPELYHANCALLVELSTVSMDAGVTSVIVSAFAYFRSARTTLSTCVDRASSLAMLNGNLKKNTF